MQSLNSLLSITSFIAWDPVQQKAAWTAPYPVVEGGGVLATAGNLVMQGRADGMLAAYRATDGKELWKFDAGTGIMGPPVTYTADGIQYVTVLAGWGGPNAQYNTPKWGNVKFGYGRILTFTLNATGKLNPPPFGHKDPPVPAITTKASPQQRHEGELLFNANCAGCHGLDARAGSLPDLRYASKENLEGIEGIVLGGSRAPQGMPSFQKILKPEQVRLIQGYIVSRAQEAAQAARR